MYSVNYMRIGKKLPPGIICIIPGGNFLEAFRNTSKICLDIFYFSNYNKEKMIKERIKKMSYFKLPASEKFCYISATRENYECDYPYIVYWNGSEFVIGSLNTQYIKGIRKTSEIVKQLKLKNEHFEVIDIKMHIWSN